MKNCPFGKDFGNSNVQKFYDMLLFCKKEEEVRKYIVLCLSNSFGKEGREMEAGGQKRKKGRKGEKGGREEKGKEKGRKEKGKKESQRGEERAGNEGRINRKLILIILLIYEEEILIEVILTTVLGLPQSTAIEAGQEIQAGL